MTYTYALIEVPSEFFYLVKNKLQEAGNKDAIQIDGGEEILDMHGLALSIDKDSKSVEQMMEKLRSSGWSVGCHNDYKLNGESYTYWQWTHPSGLYVKGEGRTDSEALEIVCREARRCFAPSP